MEQEKETEKDRHTKKTGKENERKKDEEDM